MPPKSLTKRRFEMADILNLALPYFGLIFIGFACGKTRGLPESGLAWMNFFLLYVSLPALLFRIMSETPFAELNNPPFLIATTLGDRQRLRPCHGGGPHHRRAVAAQGDHGGPCRRLRQYRLYGARAGAGGARRQGGGADRADLLLRQHLPVLDRAAADGADRSRAPVVPACDRRRRAADRAEPADHVGRAGRAGGGASIFRLPIGARPHAAVSAERRGADRAVRARRHRGAAPVRSRALGSARRDRDQAADPSA